MEKDIRITRAVRGEENLLAELCATVHDLHVRERPDLFKPVDVPGLARWFSDALTSASCWVWIARVEDVPVGYAVVIEHRRGDDVFAYARRWHEVEQLGVQLQHRRLGVARALLEHARRFAHSADVSVLGLSTHHFNEDARRAFGRCGFDATVVRMERAPSAWQPSGGRGSR